MKLIVNIKLKPDANQQRALQATLERCNDACNWLSVLGFEHETIKHFALHKLAYKDTRSKFELTAQATVRCISKVADAYKLPKPLKTQCKFHKWSAQPYDDRIFRFSKGDSVNLWTLDGRQNIPFVCGEHQRKLLPFRKGEVDLMFIRGKWYIGVVVDIDEHEPIEPQGVLGIDFGIINIAVDSTGESFSGAKVEELRQKHNKRRQILQKVGTKAAKRRLQKISGKQTRFQSITNHIISKQIVAKAERYSFSIAIEDLTGIRKAGDKATKAHRQRLSNWGFFQLRSFLEYKAKRAGIPIQTVDPRNTSRTCPVCDFISKKNRPTQAVFCCKVCGYSSNADFVAAGNIASKVSVNMPMFAHQFTPDVVENLCV
jgi:putative transposase